MRWIIGRLQYRGELTNDATSVRHAMNWRFGIQQSNAKCLGISAARRLRCKQGESHGSLWGSSVQISEDMLDNFDTSGASHMLLQEWYAAEKTLNASSKDACTRIQPIARMTLLRYVPHFLRSFGKGFLWYSVASQADEAVHQFLNNGYSMQSMPFICTVILRLEVTRDAKCMKASMD